ncbi:hypothetical protein KEM54_005696 [Ascosphaera aggregata]|nr:hypothetical protein KEM54_005696 [Ascosphaera aggregata]
MSNSSSPNSRPEADPSHQSPPSEPRAWTSASTVMPSDSAPSISNLIREYVLANDLLNDKGFLDIILCPPENVPELAARAPGKDQAAQIKAEGAAKISQQSTAAAEVPGRSTVQQEGSNGVEGDRVPGLR